MGKIIVYPHGFFRLGYEPLGLPLVLEQDGFADFSRITMKDDQKCDIPTLVLYISDVERLVVFEMTWDEVRRLAERLEAFLRRRDIEGLMGKVETLSKKVDELIKEKREGLRSDD